MSGVVTVSFLMLATLKWMSDQFGWSEAWALLGILTISVMAGLDGFFRDNPENGLLMDGKRSEVKLKKMHKDAIFHTDYRLSKS